MPGTSKLTTRLTMRIPNETLDAIKAVADRRGVTLTRALLDMVDYHQLMTGRKKPNAAVPSRDSAVPPG